MYIRDLKISSFRHLDTVRLGPFSEPHNYSDLVTLAGPNGCGKSSVLELLAQSLSSMWSLSFTNYRSMGSNSFEVEIGLTPQERSLAAESAERQGQREVSEYLKAHNSYFRATNYAEGEYQKQAGLYNQIHSTVSNTLRNEGSFQLGFFVKPDRSYKHVGFRRESIFEYQDRSTRQYFMNMGFQPADNQYSDMFEYLVQQRYHYLRALGSYYDRQKKGTLQRGDSEPADPLVPYNTLLQQLFPGYSFADKNEDFPTNLFVQIPSGELIQFADLSSGEKEVFFMLSFFLRHDVSNSVIVIDEPELHLHPELGRLLIRTMQEIKPGNQIWIATHNAEIIDESGRDRAFFISRDPTTRRPTVIAAKDEENAVSQLRQFFGFSGYIGVAKSLVFLEGTDTSSDRKLFANLLPETGSKIKLIPSRSSEDLVKLNAGVISILESGLGWLKFYLIRDRDYLPDDIAQHYKQNGKGRLCVLNRYHVENYLLDSFLIAKVQTEIFNKEVDRQYVDASLKALAQKMAAEVLRDMVSFRLNLIYQPKDFSLGKSFEGESFMLADGSWDSSKLGAFEERLRRKITETNTTLAEETEQSKLAKLVEECRNKIDAALSSDGWISLFPGRNLLQLYAKKETLGSYVAFQNSLIKEMKASAKIPDELKSIIETIESGSDFS